jgi:tetratricopeptide (TPR) repeat protein
LMLTPIAAIVLCLLAGLVQGIGPIVLVVLAVLVAAVGWLAWRQRRAGRELQRAADALHVMYVDALELADTGQVATALVRYEHAIEMSVRVHGPADPFTLELIGNLASLRLACDDLDAARDLRERAYEACRVRVGEEWIDTQSALISAASVQLAQGDAKGAGERYRQALDWCERTLDDEHPETGAALNGLARSLAAQGDLAGAEGLYRRAVDRYVRVLGPSHPDTVAAAQDQAIAAARHLDTQRPASLVVAGDLAGARRLLEHAVEEASTRCGDRDLRSAAVMSALGAVLREQRDLGAAYRWYERAANACVLIPGGPHAEMIAAANGIARVQLLQGDAVNATTTLTEVHDACLRRYGDDHPDTLAAHANLAWATSMWSTGVSGARSPGSAGSSLRLDSSCA